MPGKPCCIGCMLMALCRRKRPPLWLDQGRVRIADTRAIDRGETIHSCNASSGGTHNSAVASLNCLPEAFVFKQEIAAFPCRHESNKPSWLALPRNCSILRTSSGIPNRRPVGG